MSWWWTPKGAPGSQTRDEAPMSDAATPTDVAAPPVAAIPASELPTRTLTREERAEQEWALLLKDLQAEEYAGQPAKIPSQQQGKELQRLPVQADISPHSLYPTDMSCRSAFDYAMFCQSFGGQFVNVYRYGSFRSCSNHWDDFWLCMRTRNWDKEDRQRAIQEHYRKKAVKWKTGPSSEDIWEVRTEPVKDPISGNLIELEAELAELKKNAPNI